MRPDERCLPGSLLLGQGRDDVRVGVEGDADRAVPQALGDDLGMDAGGKSKGRVGVSEVVKAIGGSPALSTRCLKLQDRLCGWMGSSFSRVNTRPES